MDGEVKPTFSRLGDSLVKEIHFSIRGFLHGLLIETKLILTDRNNLQIWKGKTLLISPATGFIEININVNAYTCAHTV